ncbi:hypothetical protein QJS04_geneDACA005498 [Acorus gramineus]|uniref:Uncharacterized protein n=1 Tax=Acorus gramineus TaxID=55184 RepID=A0AAV9A5B7_ACOGR|nr:hypothetical protein QJS04_geneDACA005498 [Acorus gramineus]
MVKQFWAMVGAQTGYGMFDRLRVAGKAMKKKEVNGLAAVISQSIVPIGAWVI